MEKKLQRDPHHKMIAGVCAGLAEYMSVDITVVRILFLATLILHGGGLLIYIVLWIVLPVKKYAFGESFVDYRVPQNPFGTTPPFDNQGNPFTSEMPMPHKKSNGSIIAGAILIIIGSFFLLNEFDIIPDWDFSRLWPLSLVLVGLVFIVSNSKKQPWEHANWHNADAAPKDETSTENPSTL